MKLEGKVRKGEMGMGISEEVYAAFQKALAYYGLERSDFFRWLMQALIDVRSERRI